MPEKILVRKASLEDVKGIVEVYCSGVEKWFKQVKGQKVETRYEDLSIAERWSHGGPWMSIETCAIHLNYVLSSGQYPLVAIMDDKIVGELELYIGYEKGLLGRHGFIDVLEVHHNYRRRGVGRALVEKAVEIARERGCETIAVWPDPGAVGFYEKVGVNEIAYRVKYVKLDLANVKPINPSELDNSGFPEDYSVIREWFFVTPRIETSYVAWLKSRWDYAVELERLKSFESTIDGEIALIIEGIWGEEEEASLHLWVKSKDLIDQALPYSIGIAKYLGFKWLRLLVSTDVYGEHVKKYDHEVLADYVLLYRRLK